jgi:hypothetical protein
MYVRRKALGLVAEGTPKSRSFLKRKKQFYLTDTSAGLMLLHLERLGPFIHIS